MFPRACDRCAALSAVKTAWCGEFLSRPSVVDVRLTFGDNSTCLGVVYNVDDVTCSVRPRLTFKLRRCVNSDVIGKVSAPSTTSSASS